MFGSLYLPSLPVERDWLPSQYNTNADFVRLAMCGDAPKAGELRELRAAARFERGRRSIRGRHQFEGETRPTWIF